MEEEAERIEARFGAEEGPSFDVLYPRPDVVEVTRIPETLWVKRR